MERSEVLDRPDDTPSNGYSAGYLEHCLRTAFLDLCRVYGPGGAREIAQEIIASETERKRQ